MHARILANKILLSNHGVIFFFSNHNVKICTYVLHALKLHKKFGNSLKARLRLTPETLRVFLFIYLILI